MLVLLVEDNRQLAAHIVEYLELSPIAPTGSTFERLAGLPARLLIRVEPAGVRVENPT
jgi:hypothetical protein